MADEISGLTESGRDLVRKRRAMKAAGIPRHEIDAWWHRQMVAAYEARGLTAEDYARDSSPGD